jgi:small subunit ribosomal protein S6
MRDYELTYIAQPGLDATNLAALIERINGFVTGEGGVVVKVNQWGLRPLSYPIRKFRDGYYVFCVLQLEAPSLARIEQRLRLVEDVVRYLLVHAEDDGDAGDRMPDMAGGAEMNVAEPTASAPPTDAETQVPVVTEATSAP